MLALARSATNRAEERQILQEATSGGDVDVLVGSGDDGADPGPLTFREMRQDVAELVHVAAVHQGR